MRVARISQGGQIQVPAEVRHRWGSRTVLIDDQGSSLTIRPLPEDPIAAARGSLAGPGPSTTQLRASLREEDAAAEDRRHGR
jgi:bifunctional DNA-binding transcriptional regulator/antitoxin component of YhaV-PrlF toxin-antitoxin module